MPMFRSLLRTLSLVAGLTVVIHAGMNTAVAANPPGVTNEEAGSGIKAALARGAEMAVDQLARKDGFMGNDKVRIGLPDSLQKAQSAARMLGFSKQTDELVEAMNRAAEAAVVQAKPLLVNAMKNMSFRDAGSILLGAEDAATQYFKRTTWSDLEVRFRPVVKAATEKVQLAEKYNVFAGKASKVGLLDAKDADLDSYVTRKAMDGLFLMIAEEEKRIRADPIATGSSLLKKVFGASAK